MKPKRKLTEQELNIPTDLRTFGFGGCTLTPKLTLKITLRERKDGSLFFRVESSRARHRARRYDYSHGHNDPFFIAVLDYLRNEGDTIEYTQVIRAHFDGQPDEKVFVFI